MSALWLCIRSHFFALAFSVSLKLKRNRDKYLRPPPFKLISCQRKYLNRAEIAFHCLCESHCFIFYVKYILNFVHQAIPYSITEIRFSWYRLMLYIIGWSIFWSSNGSLLYFPHNMWVFSTAITTWVILNLTLDSGWQIFLSQVGTEKCIH